jgi:hypothetical protein
MKDDALRTVALSTYDQLLQEGEAIGEARGRAIGEAEGRIRGEAEGHVRGEAEGRARGELKGLQEAVVDVLEVRFGEVPYSVRERLAEISETLRIQRLLRSAATVSSMTAFESQMS